MFSTPRRILIILILTTFFSLKGSILTKSDVESSATTILNSVGSNYTGGYATCNSTCSGYNESSCEVCDGWGC
jgi:hypothetical protein